MSYRLRHTFSRLKRSSGRRMSFRNVHQFEVKITNSFRC
jgi:hypothetical protein